MKRFVFLPTTMVLATPAWAEVCDKVVGEGWSPEHGPVDVWTFSNSWKLVAFVGTVCALSLLFRSRGLGLAAALLLTIPALISVIFWLWPEDHDIARAAIREGCVSGDPLVALAGAAYWTLAAATCFVVPRFWIAGHAT